MSQWAEIEAALGQRVNGHSKFPTPGHRKFPHPLVEDMTRKMACGRCGQAVLWPVQVAVGARQRVHGDGSVHGPPSLTCPPSSA